MSILPQAAQAALDAIIAHFLPGTCLLCTANSSGGLLCSDCENDLPKLPGNRCPQCSMETTLGERCGACLKDTPAFAGTIALFRYDFPVDRLIQALKYGHQLPLATWFGHLLSREITATKYDVILPLPLHPARLQHRGFNQSAEIARTISRILNIPINTNYLIRTRATAPQTTLPPKERTRNVRGAFESTSDLSGKRILLVDDVMTTGSTLREAARILKLHGAAEITLLVVARALRH